MNRQFLLITFDIYSALFDIESSLLPLLKNALGSDIDALAFLRTWRGKQMEYVLISNSLQHGQIAFGLITGRALDYTLGRASLELSEETRRETVLAWDHLDPWPEADEVLRLRPRYQTGRYPWHHFHMQHHQRPDRQRLSLNV